MLDRAVKDGPIDDGWWLMTIDEAATGRNVGDLALHPTWRGRSAEIGYELHPEVWGKGYAVEAANALVTDLFDVELVTRISATMHPDTIASARIAEACGLVFEGHTRSSYWIDRADETGEVSDDLIYGVDRDSRNADAGARSN